MTRALDRDARQCQQQRERGQRVGDADNANVGQIRKERRDGRIVLRIFEGS